MEIIDGRVHFSKEEIQKSLSMIKKKFDSLCMLGLFGSSKDAYKVIKKATDKFEGMTGKMIEAEMVEWASHVGAISIMLLLQFSDETNVPSPNKINYDNLEQILEENDE